LGATHENSAQLVLVPLKPIYKGRRSVTQTRVSNGRGQCNFLGQRDRSSFIVPGQRENGTRSKSCQWTGGAGTAKIRDGTGQNSQNPGRDAGQRSLSRNICSCPCPGTRNFFCPGTKGQQDVPSRFVPGRPVPVCLRKSRPVETSH
jgi:hypothetical protein